MKFESLQDTLLEHEKLADKSRQAAEKAARAEQHDLLLRIEGMRAEAEDKRAREQRAWEGNRGRKSKSMMRRRIGSVKNTRKSGRGQDDIAQERRARETELHAALLAKYCSK